MDSVGKGFNVRDFDFKVKENNSKQSLCKSRLFSVYEDNNKNRGTQKTREIAAREINKENFIDTFISKLPERVTINVDDKGYSQKTSSLREKFGLGKTDENHSDTPLSSGRL